MAVVCDWNRKIPNAVITLLQSGHVGGGETIIFNFFPLQFTSRRASPGTKNERRADEGATINITDCLCRVWTADRVTVPMRTGAKIFRLITSRAKRYYYYYDYCYYGLLFTLCTRFVFLRQIKREFCSELAVVDKHARQK